ncbi:hypothetical protein [Geodermatophilus ruber]|uniref:Uncharacterized protein n=1 Tax=Geodermatophilus ruber TaxID=504800 RepID=A0A1I4F8X4_9ACTN|nr:hypothetical protein [Geodermatophilus ruber]SFL13903.1 hypothetical protein SAMN04488085_10721 [Geodermatophilus ruber]
MSTDAVPPDPFAGPAPGAPDPDDGPVPTLLAASWEQAEARLYPVVLEQTEVYQRIVRLVRATADRLRLLGPGTSALVAAAERGPELVAAAVDDSGVPAAGLDLELLARAALALRYRELRGEQAARRRLRRLGEGRTAGAAWVVVEEAGDPAGDPFRPYSRLEVASASGRGVLVTTAPDDAYRAVTHAVRRVLLDLGTGEVEEDPDEPDALPCADADAREATAAALRSRIASF